MREVFTFSDKRSLAYCAFCGGETGTRDHCPSRVFLDRPYPENLPIVPACSACNSRFSIDEEYLACFLSCSVAGTTDPDAQPRDKTRRILNSRPLLRKRIEQAYEHEERKFKPESERIISVATKLAQGHALFELNEAYPYKPDVITFAPITLLTKDEREAFENPEPPQILPEVGSRMMQRLATGVDLTPDGWIIVQPNCYRFHVSAGNGVDVRIVIQEYLTCLITWKT